MIVTHYTFLDQPTITLDPEIAIINLLHIQLERVRFISTDLTPQVRRLPGRRALVVVFIKNILFEIIAFVVFECL